MDTSFDDRPRLRGRSWNSSRMQFLDAGNPRAGCAGLLVDSRDWDLNITRNEIDSLGSYGSASAAVAQTVSIPR